MKRARGSGILTDLIGDLLEGVDVVKLADLPRTFTVEGLREILVNVLKRSAMPASIDLHLLAAALNKISDEFNRAKGFPALEALELDTPLSDHELLEFEINALKQWRDIAEPIASAFRRAMEANNPKQKFGLSNDGPVPRFVTAVIPLIAGDKPNVANVAKHLKDMARVKKGQTRAKFSPPTSPIGLGPKLASLAAVNLSYAHSGHPCRCEQ